MGKLLERSCSDESQVYLEQKQMFHIYLYIIYIYVCVSVPVYVYKFNLWSIYI